MTGQLGMGHWAMNWNLDPPPGFRGLDPHAPMKIYVRNLPHWRQQGATYFATFHLADAIPKNKRNELEAMRREWEHRYPPPRDESAWTEYAKAVFRKVERWMDTGYGKCWLRREPYANELKRSILHFQAAHYEVGCFAIVGNHCHLTMRPFDGFELEDELGSIKSVTAHFIGRHEATEKPLWQQESYDRIIRDAEHLYRVVQYIGANPRRAGIPREQWCRWMNPAWKSAGWDFVDPPSP